MSALRGADVSIERTLPTEEEVEVADPRSVTDLLATAERQKAQKIYAVL
jgi:hypothetical protein